MACSRQMQNTKLDEKECRLEIQSGPMTSDIGITPLGGVHRLYLDIVYL